MAAVPGVRRSPHELLLAALLMLLTLVAGLGLATPAAVGAPPERLADELTDAEGLLSTGAVDRVGTAQDTLVTDARLQLFVVVVDTFDDQDPQAWMEETASLSQLGDNDLALAVASQDRDLVLRLPDGTGLQGRSVSDLRDRAEGLLADGDVEGAVLTVAEGLTEVPRTSAGERTGRVLAWTVGLAAVVLVAGVVALSLWRRARARTQAAEDLERSRELAREHGGLAVELDEAVAAADLEVGFARAEFEPPLVASMAETVAGARDQGLEGHRRRGAVVSGPVDDPHWLVPPAQAREELTAVVDLTRTALDRVRAIPVHLDELRRQSDLVPTRIAGLSELARDRAPRDAQIAGLLERARADVGAGRPESALIPLRTLVAILGPESDPAG